MQKNLDSVYFVFAAAVVLIYIVITPYLLVQEYKNNPDFKDLIACEYRENEPESCAFHRKMQHLSEKSNIMVSIVILFWGGIIFERDIWPNRKKIQDWFDNLQD